MGKRASYEEDLLTSAVIKYAEVYAGKIKATNLAAWASANIEGLQGVKDYHFLRPVTVKDPVTGKKTTRKKTCTERIEDYNKVRTLTASISTNVLIRSSNPDSFFELSKTAQREIILETKELFNTIERRNAALMRKNDMLSDINEACKEKNKEIDEKLAEIETKIKRLERNINTVMKLTDKANRTKVLADMGIANGTIDAGKYLDSLRVDVNNVFDINKEIAAFFSDNSSRHTDIMEMSDLKNSIMSVFDKDEDSD